MRPALIHHKEASNYKINHVGKWSIDDKDHWQIVDLEGFVVADCTQKHNAQIICRLLNTNT